VVWAGASVGAGAWAGGARLAGGVARVSAAGVDGGVGVGAVSVAGRDEAAAAVSDVVGDAVVLGADAPAAGAWAPAAGRRR